MAAQGLGQRGSWGNAGGWGSANRGQGAQPSVADITTGQVRPALLLVTSC